MEIWKYFKALFYPILKILDWYKQFVLKYFTFVFSILLVVLTPVNWLFDVILSWVLWMDTKVIELKDIVDTFWQNLDSNYSGIAQTLAIANALFPLSQLFVIINLLIGAYILANLYRLIKSWLPTLS